MKHTQLTNLTLGNLFELYSGKKIIFQSTLSIPYRLPYRADNFIDNIQLLFTPARVATVLIIAIQNDANRYEILYENIELSTLLHYIGNEIALPKCAKGKKVFGELSGKYFRDLPCIVQKSMLQTNISLFMVFEKDEKKLHSEVDALIQKFTF
jgi:hypothetical protein